MGLSLLQGRDLDWRDIPQAQSVAVVTMNLAQSLFPQGNMLGKTIQVIGGQRANIQIVGIVSNSRIEAIKEPESLIVFVPEAQEPQYMSSPFVEIQAQGDSSALIGAVRQSLESWGHDYPIMVNTVASTIEDSILPERLTAALSRVYAAFALLLVSIGLYGLISYTVSRRTAEIGVGWPSVQLRACLMDGSAVHARPYIGRLSHWHTIRSGANPLCAANALWRLIRRSDLTRDRCGSIDCFWSSRRLHSSA